MTLAGVKHHRGASAAERRHRLSRWESRPTLDPRHGRPDSLRSLDGSRFQPTGLPLRYSLLAIGAHDGQKLMPSVQNLMPEGEVLLVEALPELYARLRQTYAAMPSIRTRNACISTTDGPVSFTRAKPSALQVLKHADQLGSVNAGHAAAHHPALSEHFETVELPGVSFRTLIRQEQVEALDALVLDTEGHDVDLLLSFPYSDVMPDRIFFEFKHADGPFRLGRKLGQLLILLDVLGYHVQAKDSENLLATRRP